MLLRFAFFHANQLVVAHVPLACGGARARDHPPMAADFRISYYLYKATYGAADATDEAEEAIAE